MMLRIFTCDYISSVNLFCEMSIQTFCPIFNWAASFLIVEFEECFVYFGQTPLSDMCFADIFFHSGTCLFILFNSVFTDLKFLILKKSNLLSFLFHISYFGVTKKSSSIYLANIVIGHPKFSPYYILRVLWFYTLYFGIQSYEFIFVKGIRSMHRLFFFLRMASCFNTIG